MLKSTSSIVNVSQITGVLPVVNGGTGVTTSTGTGNTVLSAAPTLSGNVTLSTGNLIVANGQGIDFSANPSAAGMTSELLNDYEEGTWTPAVIGSTTAGTAAYFYRNGRYTKVGRLVTFECSTYFISGTGTGNMQISGLPFASNSASTYPSFAVGYSVTVTTLTAGSYLSAVMIANSSTVIDIQQVSTVTGSATALPYFPDGALFISGSYTV
jgi:hypothetical protein